MMGSSAVISLNSFNKTKLSSFFWGCSTEYRKSLTHRSLGEVFSFAFGEELYFQENTNSFLIELLDIRPKNKCLWKMKSIGILEGESLFIGRKFFWLYSSLHLVQFAIRKVLVPSNECPLSL